MEEEDEGAVVVDGTLAALAAPAAARLFADSVADLTIVGAVDGVVDTLLALLPLLLLLALLRRC